jgi:hypothetical protein
MKCLTYFTTDNNRIDIQNTFFGLVSIYYNGSLVSQKHSLFGICHTFQIMENGISALYEIIVGSKFSFNIGFDIYKNGKPLLFS